MNNQRKKIKIAFFLHSLQGAGAERNTINLIRNLNKGKYQVSLVLMEKRGVFLSKVPQQVLVTELKSNSFVSLFLKLIKYFNKEKPDIFVSSFPHFNSISVLAKIFSKSKTKIILVEHTTYSLIPATARTLFRKIIARFFLPFLIKISYPKAKAIVCVSFGVAKDILNIVGSSEKINVIYNPVVDKEISRLAEEPVSHPWFEQDKIPNILAGGRLSRAKDYPNLLKAFSLVLKKQLARLVILGEGPERNKLEKLISKLNLSENVALLGFQKNPYKYMKRASVFVLSSFREGFGDVIVEAMACGLPVISTICVGPSEIIEDGKNGILVAKRDEKDLAEAILRVLNDSSLSQRLSQQGKKRAQDFTIEKSLNQYEKIFNQINI